MVLVWEDLGIQKLIYYVNHVLNGPKIFIMSIIPPHREASICASIGSKEAHPHFQV